MPIVEIEIVLRVGESLRPQMASELANQLGDVFAASPQTTWVKLRALPVSDYAENGGRHSEAEPPVFVSVLKRKQPPPSDMQQEVDRIIAAVAGICDRKPVSVHIIYLPDGAGRVAFGGRIVK